MLRSAADPVTGRIRQVQSVIGRMLPSVLLCKVAVNGVELPASKSREAR